MATPHRKHSSDDPMEESLINLTDVYRCLVSGSWPQYSVADVACAVFSGVCVHARRIDVSCLSLSVLHRLVSGAEESRFYKEVLGDLHDRGLLDHLVQHFLSEDQIVSHLAAKSVSAWVFYNLQTYGTVSPAWQKKCVQAFQTSPPSAELDACLWSLTAVLKRLLKRARHDILGDLLSAFDCSLLTLCSKFLPEEGSCATQRLVVFTPNSQQQTSFCLLLDLLELLSVSGVCVQSQRLIYTRSRALLTATSHSTEYFVKKKAALLLKRAVLQKLGEDLALPGTLSSGLKHTDSSSDKHMLADIVLTATNQGWLQSVEVRLAAFFGGTKPIRDGETHKSDGVMLRALSLIILKSIELQVQTSGGAAVGEASEVYVHLEHLWGFLRRSSIQLASLCHLCCWISLLFGEQDDDMMEAAKALLAMFLFHREKTMKSLSDHSVVLDTACSSGFNPHCHFILLLQSISFDHSILLDFLISSETCFLEYFVRYLKCLRDDWPGFIAACGFISVSDCKLPLQETASAPLHGETFSFASRLDASSCVSPVQRRLVDYDFSDESEPEDMEVSDAQPGPSVCRRQFVNVSRLPVSPSQKQFLSSKSANTATGLGSGVATSMRTAFCLSQLGLVVVRLHSKKLFPYNPSSLLKLLTQVENISQQSHL